MKKQLKTLLKVLKTIVNCNADAYKGEVGVLNIIIESNYEETCKRLPDRISNVRDYFDTSYEPEWFDDEFVRKIIKDIDNTTVVSGINLYNEVLLGISPESLSSGSKALIILFEEDYIVNGDRLGDNCIELLLEIAKQKDITITTSHILPLPISDKLPVKTVVHGYGEIKSKKEFVDVFVNEVYGEGEALKDIEGNRLDMSIDISIKSKRLEYEFEIKEKVTFILGDSATGKTKMVSLINNLNNPSVKINVSNDFDLISISESEFSKFIKHANRRIQENNYSSLKEYWANKDNFPIVNSVIVIDDENFVESNEFATFVNADKYNYYIIINRTQISKISYSVYEVYTLKTNGKSHWLESWCNALENWNNKKRNTRQ